MKFVELASFDVVHDGLSWPWLAFDPSGKRVAFASSKDRIATRALDGDAVSEGPSFALPLDVALASLRGFAIDPAASLLAITGTLDSVSVLITCAEAGEERRTTMESLVGAGFAARAVIFERSGARLWLSAESETETALLLVDARSHALIGVARSAVFPPPATHELYLHPQDDAVLLVAACGEDGTFARVVGWSGDAVEAIPSALDAGGIPAGFVGFSVDATRVHLAEADELRTHAWPALQELSSVELADDFVSSFAGAVLGEHVYVDGEYAEVGEDAVMRFDRSAIRGKVLLPPVPIGMWAGRLATDVLVTVEAKGEPASAHILRVIPPDTSN